MYLFAFSRDFSEISSCEWEIVKEQFQSCKRLQTSLLFSSPYLRKHRPSFSDNIALESLRFHWLVNSFLIHVASVLFGEVSCSYQRHPVPCDDPLPCYPLLQGICINHSQKLVVACVPGYRSRRGLPSLRYFIESECGCRLSFWIFRIVSICLTHVNYSF